MKVTADAEREKAKKMRDTTIKLLGRGRTTMKEATSVPTPAPYDSGNGDSTDEDGEEVPALPKEPEDLVKRKTTG